MRIACVGKGGSGKTSVAMLLSKWLAHHKKPIITIDADINQHLGDALGLTEKEQKTTPQLGNEMQRIKTYLRGTNKNITTPKEMIKTSPPGTGSQLLTFSTDKFWNYFERNANGVRLLSTGEIQEQDIGVRCYHAKTGIVELILNHLVDKKDEWVVVDMTAGADAFASGIFTKFDLLLVIVEPTKKSLKVYKQYKKHAEEFGVTIKALGNKIFDKTDEKYLRTHIGTDLLGVLSMSAWMKKTERGEHPPITEVEKENLHVIEHVVSFAHEQKRNWKKQYQDMIFFHERNCESWANHNYGKTLQSHIDPNYNFEAQVNDILNKTQEEKTCHTHQ